MRVRFWSETGDQYVTIRPEEFKGTVKKRRERKTMPIPKQSKPNVDTSYAAILAMGEAEAKGLLIALVEDIETTLQNSGKDGMISLKLGYKSGYQVSLKTSKTGMWYNVSCPTLLDCFNQYLQGEFDNA
jgi:hypothetical protein